MSNMISRMRQEVQSHGTTCLNVEDFNALQADWIKRSQITSQCTVDPTNNIGTGALYEKALKLRMYASAWEKSVQLIGDITAEDLAAICSDYAKLRLEAGVSSQ